ncbi:MAG: hypothetical protein ABSG90_14495 [Dehalococcoidia bacterium]|jgi:hypothetical protein
MIKTLLRGLRDWMAGLAGTLVFTIVGLSLLLPLVWLEHHHHGVFELIVIMSVWLSIMFIRRLASGPGRQICPHCGKAFFGTDMP